MMKKIKTLLILIFTNIAIISCSEEFLDERPTNYISIKDFEESSVINPQLATASLNGIYNQMVTTYIGGTEQQEDFGHKSFDIFSDLLSSDLAQVSGNYNRFVQHANLLWTVDPSIQLPNFTAWRFYYTIIKSANLIIAGTGGNDAIPQTDALKSVLGQAKALRAFAYFYLSQFYALEYEANEEILPIYTLPGQNAQPKSKMSEVYNLMINDLNSAIDLLSSYSRPNKNYINKNVAKGLLAYVYSSMGQSDTNILAKNLANEIINSGEFTLMTSGEVTGGFTKLTTPGWMWGFDLTPANGLGLISWHGFMDFFSYSYQAVGNNRSIDKGLYDQIAPNDIRKQQFGNPVKIGTPQDPNEFKGFNVGEAPLIPARKFYNLDLRKFGQAVIEDDYIYMRVAEMYLLSAEMAAVEGEELEAKNTLKQLLSQRFEDAADYAYVDGLSGQNLIDEIIFQTKIELIAEGKSYLLMKRRKLTNTRGANHLNRAGESFMYNDPRLTFSIPQDELINNPFISTPNK